MDIIRYNFCRCVIVLLFSATFIIYIVELFRFHETSTIGIIFVFCKFIIFILMTMSFIRVIFVHLPDIPSCYRLDTDEYHVIEHGSEEDITAFLKDLILHRNLKVYTTTTRGVPRHIKNILLLIYNFI